MTLNSRAIKNPKLQLELKKKKEKKSKENADFEKGILKEN